MSDFSVLAPMLRKFETRRALDPEDRAAVLALPYQRRTVDRGTHFVREGERPERSCLILSGFAFRQKVTARGGRQIVSLHIPGDFVDLPGALLNIADHNVEALSRCELATFARADIRALVCARPTVALALWIDTLIDASISREWVVNIGRREALPRIAHILCELGRRLQVAGLASPDHFEMPMNQEQLADAAGLTAVHVNRTLRELDRTGLIARVNRSIQVKDWKGLRELADFNENYLHFDQVAVEDERNGAAATSGGARMAPELGALPD